MKKLNPKKLNNTPMRKTKKCPPNKLPQMEMKTKNPRQMSLQKVHIENFYDDTKR
jgi:hypothetical protein